MEWLGECRVVMFLWLFILMLPLASLSKVLVINRLGKLLYACCVYIKNNIFITFADNMMKLSFNKGVVHFNINASPLSKVKPNFKKNCLVYELVTGAYKILRHLCCVLVMTTQKMIL